MQGYTFNHNFLDIRILDFSPVIVICIGTGSDAGLFPQSVWRIVIK